MSDQRLQELLQRYKKDPDSVSYEQIRSLTRYDPNTLYIIPYINPLREYFHGELAHELRLMLTKPLDCSKKGYNSKPKYIQVGEISGGLRDDIEEQNDEGVSGPPYYFSSFDLAAPSGELVELFDEHQESILDVLNRVICYNSDPITFINNTSQDYGGTLPWITTELISYRYSLGKVLKKEYFFSAVEAWVTDFAQNLIDWGYFDYKYPEFDKIVLLNHLFGKENIKLWRSREGYG